MPTIPRNHKRKIADIAQRATTCHVYSLGNGFVAKECAPAVAWGALAEYSFARLTQEAEDKYVIRVHGNLWYELRPPQ